MNMAKGSEKDLATMLGDPKKAIAAMTLPMLVSYVVMEVNLFVDTFWTSGLGPEASSAISTVAPLYAIFGAFGVGLGVAASATISFRLGKGDKEGASALAGNTMVLGALVSIAVSAAVFLLMDPLMEFMGADDIADLGREYIMPFVLTSWALILHSVVAGILRAEGATGGSITAKSFFKTSGSSTAIKDVVCLLHPDGASTPACNIVTRSSLGTGLFTNSPL